MKLSYKLSIDAKQNVTVRVTNSGCDASGAGSITISSSYRIPSKDCDPKSIGVYCKRAECKGQTVDINFESVPGKTYHDFTMASSLTLPDPKNTDYEICAQGCQPGRCTMSATFSAAQGKKAVISGSTSMAL